MSNYQDPYRVLGVSPDATEEQITKAYRKLAKKYHPDLNPGDAAAEQKMREINAAYDQIKNIREGKAAGARTGGAYGGYGAPGSGYGRYGGSGQNGAYTSMDAVRIYLRTHRYMEALHVLNGISARNAQWYYYSALANYGIGRHIIALEHAAQAVRMEPGNEEYRLLYQRLQAGGTVYQQRRQSGSMANEALLWCCLGSTCLGFCMRGGVCLPFFCF
jgi:molecular chaperone DnaJ